MADGDSFFQFHIEKGLDMLFGEQELADAQARFDALGREGWQLSTSSGPFLIFQRLVMEEAPAQPESAEPGAPSPEPSEGLADPFCGCGCGDPVMVTETQYREATKSGLHWFAAGHGLHVLDHDGPYMAAPLRARHSSR